MVLKVDMSGRSLLQALQEIPDVLKEHLASEYGRNDEQRRSQTARVQCIVRANESMWDTSI